LTIVGSGTNWSRLNLLGGTHSYANGLSISTNAWLTGSGSVLGSVLCSGAVAPGAPFGSFGFNNDLVLSSSSDLAFDIGGYSAGGDYDYIFVAGNLTRNGNLRVSLAAGFVPGAGDTFVVLQSTGGSGSFANVLSGARLKTTDSLGSFLVTYNASSVQLSSYQSTDLDGDGIEDAWATQYFGGTPLPGGSGPNDKFGDKDGDGLNNYAEFIAGTNPTNAASVLKLTVTSAGSSSVGLQFPYEFGRTYRLWLSTDLSNWVELAAPGYTRLPPGLAQWRDDGSVPGSAPFDQTSSRFYRLSVE
jgi:hypothetical protein